MINKKNWITTKCADDYLTAEDLNSNSINETFGFDIDTTWIFVAIFWQLGNAVELNFLRNRPLFFVICEKNLKGRIYASL